MIALGPFLESSGDWQLEHGYGYDNTSKACEQYLGLRSSGSTGILAPMDGMLLAIPPDGGNLDSLWTTDEPDLDPPIPNKINLFLHLEPLQFLSKAKGLLDKTSTINGLLGFALLNVDTSTLESALETSLDHLAVTTAVVKRRPAEKVEFDSPKMFSRRQALKQFLNGTLGVPLRLGQSIGSAFRDGSGNQQFGFAAITKDGLVDPLHVYQLLASWAPSDLPAKLAPFKNARWSGWPVFPTSTTQNELLAAVDARIYPFPALAHARRTLTLDPAAWDDIRVAQKKHYLRRLMAFAGHGTGDAPRFEFDMLDWRNPFQLEAVVEFYANHREPWDDTSAPILPESDDYVKVSLQNYRGASAIVSGKDVQLVGEEADPVFEGAEVWPSTPNGTTTVMAQETPTAIELFDSMSGNAVGRMCAIKEIDRTARKLVLEEAPSPTPVSPRWEYHRRPILVLIDSFGGRLRGESASISADNVVQLDSSVDLSQVNRAFDSIYLESDAGSPTKAYRITQVDSANHTVTVQPRANHSPQFTGTSRWRIPAGLCSQVEPLAENMGPGDRHGNDHFDGMMFVVKDGVIEFGARWSSYTARWNLSTVEFQSSVRGNSFYDVLGYKSGKKRLNFCFEVRDVGQIADHVSGAKFYYEPTFRSHAGSNGKVIWDNTGKKAGKDTIRIHYSDYTSTWRDAGPPKNDPNVHREGKWSAGCLTSPHFTQMRDVLIELEQRERRACGKKDDADLAKIYGMREMTSIFSLNALSFAGWTGNLKAWLWVIHPDELPEGWSL